MSRKVSVPREMSVQKRETGRDELESEERLKRADRTTTRQDRRTKGLEGQAKDEPWLQR